jgi:alkylhydroperoxidase family enzyme
MARIPYLDEADVPEEYRSLLTTHLADSLSNVEEHDNVVARNIAGGSRNIYRLFAHEPEVLRSHREHLTLMWESFAIPPQERELALLVLAHELGIEYEWHHHIPIALDEGVSPDELRAIANREFDGFDDRERALLVYAERFARQDVDDATHDAVAEAYSDDAMLGLSVLLGFYVLMAYTLDALDVDLEEEFVGWNLENV